MYTVQLEIELYFVPPMKEKEAGIGLVKTIELPFSPVPDMGLVGSSLEQHPFPPGFVIKELSWDVDRSLFLAKVANMIFHDEPLGLICAELQTWLDHGWSEGVIQDYYEDEHEDHEPAPDKTNSEFMAEVMSNCERDLSIPARHKTSSFRACLRGVVRLMVECRNSLATAYAMDQTGRFVTNDNRHTLMPKELAEWDRAVTSYDSLTIRQQEAWMRRVRRYEPFNEIDVDIEEWE